MKEVLGTVSIIAVLFLIALRVIGFESITVEDGIFYGVFFLGSVFMTVTEFLGYFDPSVPVCSCGRPLREIRNGCKTHYDPGSNKP